ncbi:MAG: SLBB domain-containing protein [Sphingomonadaceae bacterium]
MRIARHLLIGLAVTLAQPLVAQAIDPQVLDRIQQTLGVTQAARAAAETAQQAAEDASRPATILQPGGRVDTPEEQEVRRAQARRELLDLYDPSPVEQDFRLRLGDQTLRQFGYDFFQAAPPPTGARTGAVGDSYILGIGDELQIAFRGATTENRTARVDRDGRILVGQLPPIQAAGRSLGAVKAQIAAETRRTMLATDVYVSVGDIRSVSVFVGGEVVRPGQYSLTSVSDVVTAIAQAGGIRRTGSLRNVRIVRAGGASVSVDLYGFLGIGTPPNIRLQDGDRIIVPVIGPTIAIAGAVARPAVYELRGPASTSAVLAFAGGPIRQRGAEIVLGRIDRSGTERFERVAGTASIQGGDALLVVDGSAGGASGRVALLGHVANPGARSLASAPTVQALLRSPQDLRADTYLPFAMLVRRNQVTGAREFIGVDLSREWLGPGTPLLAEDRLILFSQEDIAFLSAPEVRSVTLGRDNPLPDCPGMARLAELISLDRTSPRYRLQNEDAGGMSFRARRAQESRRAAAGRTGEEGRRAAPDRTGEEEPDTGCPQIFVDEPDLLALLLERVVLVSGSVRRPGAYPIAGPVPVSLLAAAAEGLSERGRAIVVNLTRGRTRTTQQFPLGTGLVSDQLALVEPGDDLRFAGERLELDLGGVQLTGEVRRPGFYSIRRGETLSELLERAGGLTEFAYPYGAVFTRESVAAAQQEGFQRTARELNNSLLAVTARSPDRGAEGLQGAAALIQLIAAAPAPGRMVVEADPRVLAMRPDLDTILEPGDSIFFPRRPNFILATGDLSNPGALQFVEGKRLTAYLRDAGGTMQTADERRAFIVFPNGTAQPLRGGLWSGRADITPPPGSTIVVPKNIDPLYRLSIFRDISTILANLAVSAATIGVLATN